ncbi:small-subunit processome [Umbelopsis sp. AD052]|nr:small-subunit processome [Umbelopsis sp. AD052]
MAAPKRGKGKQPVKKGKQPTAPRPTLENVFEADDEEQNLARRGHDFDDVDNYEYNVDNIDDEDDEDIDSDDAFNESDEERFENFKFAGSHDKKLSSKARGSKSALLADDDELEEEEASESEDDEEEDDGEEFMDLSEMLGAGDSEEKTTKNAAFETLLPGSDSEDEADELKDFSEDEEEEASGDMISFVSSLPTKKRKNAGEDGRSKRSKKLAERTEAYDENEFSMPAHSASVSGAKKKLDLADLMGTLDDDTGFGGLKKNLEALEGSGKSKIKDTLSAPLPKRIQDRLNRQAAYKEAKDEVGKWQPLVKQNREADHLSFPMVEKAVAPNSNAALTSTFQAETSMEKQIEEALAAAGMKDKEEEEFEALELNKLSVEEVQARRNELRMMRELMFRHELKAKRIKKIKSKAYRKVARKEKLKELAKIQAQIAEDDPEAAREEQLQAETDRALERMSLRHKNTGKWAQQQIKRGNMDEGTRDAINDQIRRGEQLRRKVQGMDSDEEFNDSDNDEDSPITAEEQLNQIREELDEEEPAGTGIFAMKFMKDAAKREKKETEALLQSTHNGLYADGDDSSDEVEAKQDNYAQVANNPGRMMYGVSKIAKQDQKEDTDSSSVNINLNEAGEVHKVSSSAAHATKMSGPVNVKLPSKSPLADLDNATASNPWLQADTSKLAKQSRKANKAQGKIEDKAEHLISKMKKNQKSKQEDAEEDVEIDLDNVLTIAQAKSKQASKATPAKPTTAAAAKTNKENGGDAAFASDDEDDGSDVDENGGMVHTKNPLAFTQRELVEQAFANDNVVEEFEEEKREAMEEDAPKDEDLTLPGWGAWGGKGLKDRKNKVVKKALPGEGVVASKRRDAKLGNVIISEKRIKKAAKYQVTSIPFPFQNREQYERSLRAPLGKEWNTTDSFQKMTKPRVMTKLGRVIDPLKAPFK